MKFDWDREWYPGEEPEHKKMKWKDYAEKYPLETFLLIILSIGLIVWVGIK